MSFNQKLLYNDEQVVIDRHPHWWYLVPSGFVLVLAAALGIWVLVMRKKWAAGTVASIAAAVLVAVALGWFLVRLIKWRTTLFVVTTERCIYRHGVFRTSGIEIPLDRINTVFFNQTFFERILRAGDIGIESAGENSRQEFSDVYDPVKVQNTIYKLMEDNEHRNAQRLGAAVGAGGGLSVAEQLEKLAALHAQGHLSDQEFATQKAALLGPSAPPTAT